MNEMEIKEVELEELEELVTPGVEIHGLIDIFEPCQYTYSF